MRRIKPRISSRRVASYVFVFIVAILSAAWGLRAVPADETPIGSKWWPSE